MFTVEEKQIMNLSDIYTLMYGYIAHALIEKYGLRGEAAVREGTRRYGRDRGRATRGKHLKMNAKINMKHLFSLCHDLPNDPRFRRKKLELNPQERVSHTLICPMADIWKSHGQLEIGRIYCEEFHPACYSEYAYGYTHVNLARTQTQKGDEYCSFNVVLRPSDLPEELLPVCFEEFDPGYVKPELHEEFLSAKDGFEQISIKLFYYLLSTTEEQIGPQAVSAVEQGIKELAGEAAKLLFATAQEYDLPIDNVLMYKNVPISLDFASKAAEWAGYTGCDAQGVWERSFKAEFWHQIHQ